MYEQESVQEEVIADLHLPTKGGKPPLTAFRIKKCDLCDTIIAYRPQAHRKYCKACAKKQRYKSHRKYVEKDIELANKRKRESKWRNKERLGLFYEKRYFINKCIICGQNISMYPTSCKYCVHCREKHIHELGTIKISSHMKRRYDDKTKTVLPDFEWEGRIIHSLMRHYGLNEE